MNQDSAITDKIYEFITETGEDRACESISEKSCKEVPGNYFLNTFNGFSSKWAEQLASPELIIPWVFSLLSVPPVFTGLLIPFKNAGSLLPQLFVSAKIRAFPKRKYFWSGAAFAQSLMMLFIAWGVIRFTGSALGFLTVGALMVFSMASGIASIAFKDVVGKTIPKGKRGSLLALRATGGGVLTVLTGVLMYFFFSGEKDPGVFSWLFVCAAVLWLVASILFFFIEEGKGATEGGRTPIKELKNGWKILKEDVNFRNFLITRGLLLSIPLVQPYLILYAEDRIGLSLQGMGLFVIITGISQTISSPFWGKFADRSSRKMMIFTSLFAAVVCAYVVIFNYFPSSWINTYTYAPVFFLIIMAYSGARMARKTYLIDYAPEGERPLYVSLANTSIGILVVLSGVLGLIANFFGLIPMILVLMGLMLLAARYASMLQEA